MGEEKKSGMEELSGLVRDIRDITRNIKELTRKKRFDEAIGILERLRESGAMGVKERVVLGELYAETGKWGAAADMMIEALKEDPSNRKAYTVLEKASEHGIDEEKYMAFYQELVSRKELTDRSIKAGILQKLLDHYRDRDDRKALMSIKEALYDLDPSNRSYQSSLCEEYMLHMRRDEKALEVYEKAYRQNPRNGIVRKHICASYRELHRDRWRNLDVCLAHYAEEPDDLENVRYLASSFMKKDEHIDDKIVEIYNLCLDRDMLDRGSLLFHRGLYFEKRQKTGDAIESYEEAFRVGYGEKDHFPLQRLAFLYDAQKEADKAREYFLKQHELYPEDEITGSELQRILLNHDALGRLDCEELVTASGLLTAKTSLKTSLAVAERLIDTCRDHKTALKCIELALSRDPSNIEALEGKQKCLVSLGLFDKAVETLEKKLSQKLRKTEAVQSYIELAGLCRDSLKDLEKADNALTKALSIDPLSFECWSMKISLQKEKGDDDKLHESLREAWKIFPIDEKILRELRDYYAGKKMTAALYVIDEVLFLTGRGAKPPRQGVAVPEKTDDYVDEKDRKGREKVRFYLSTLDSLRIKTGDLKSDSDLDKIRSLMKEMSSDDGALVKSLMDKCGPLLGAQDVKAYALEGDDTPFRVRAVADLDEKLLLLNPPFFRMLSADIELALTAQALAHHRFEHTELYRSIRVLNTLIVHYIDRLIRYVETSVKGSNDYLRAPLLFLVSQLKQEKMRKKVFETVLTHLESFIHHPLLVDLIKDTSSLVLFKEGSVNDFEEGASFTADNVAFGVTKDLSAATAAAIYDSSDDLRDTELTAEKRVELIGSGPVRDRVTHLWNFALSCALKEKATV